MNKIFLGEASDILSTAIPPESVDLTITSPPYDKLRDYNGYKFDSKEIIKALYAVTKKGGVCVWVVGDAVIKGGESGTSFRQALQFIDTGWILHDTMIYEKNGAAYPPNDKSTRYGQIFEYMFVFSKGKIKTANLIKDKPNRWAGHTTFGNNTERTRNGELKKRKSRGEMIVQPFGYRNNIWRYNNGYGYTTKDKWAYEHPAMFPEELAKDHILSWSNEGDTVLDPMCGAGTTLKMAKQLKRNYIGIDLSEKYCKLAQKRVQDGTISESPETNKGEGDTQTSSKGEYAREHIPIWSTDSSQPTGGISSTDNKEDFLEGGSD